MFDYKTNDSAALTKELGVFLQPGIGLAYPDLKDQLLRLYRDKVSKLNFVPFGWYAAVLQVQEAHPNDLVRLAPVMLTNGTIIKESADFTIQSEETAQAWDAIFRQVGPVIGAYAAKQQEAGRKQLEVLYQNATFWNRVYNIADSIVTAPGRLTDKIMDSLSNPVKVLMYGGIVLAIVYFTYQTAGPIIRAKYTK